MQLPSLMADEHLYSAFIRARYLSGQMHLSSRRFFELNNLKYHWLRSQAPLCENLNHIVQRFSDEPLVQFQLRLHHTPFAPWLLSSPPELLPEELTHAGTRSNIEESPFQIDKRWKLCKQCADQDLAELGYSYWHSRHQLLGARVCPIHQQPLMSHDELRYLDFSLPHHWINKATPLIINESWQAQWQPFIFCVARAIQADPAWAYKVKVEIRSLLGIEASIRRSDKLYFDILFAQMSSELGNECLAGLFKAFASERRIRTNLLWVTLSTFGQATGLRHPLYWLAILFWLRKKLPLLQL